MTDEERHNSNARAWDEAAARYETEIARDIVFLRAGGMDFAPPELAYLDNLNAWCQRAIHLQCAAGRDTLSLWNRGAREVVGVDINARMIAAARAKSDALGAPAQWRCSDVLHTPHELDGTADLVYTGRGALCWLMDLGAWADVIARLLKPGGKLYVFEGHPLDWVWDQNGEDFRLDPVYGDYFQREPVADQGWPESYIPATFHPEAPATKWERQWTLGDVINPLIGVGLRLLRLEEHPERYWNVLPQMPPERQEKLPHTYSLFMEKPL